MIKIENLSFKYKEGNYILKDINLEIKPGECVAIVGKNGSGKSTLAKLISGIIKPSKGEVIVNDINTKDKKEHINLRKTIGIVFQNPENQILFNNIDDELAFALRNLSLDNQEQRINQALEKVKIKREDIGDIDEMSLGQKQRIAIASVLAVDPQYIVLDEPTTMIDGEGKEAVYNIIKELVKEKYTILYITNNTEETLLADRILVLDEGRIVEQINRNEILNKIEVFKKYNIKVPIEVEIVDMLRQNNIKIEPKELNIAEIVEKIIEKVK